MLSNAYFLAKFRSDTAENEPAKNLQNFRKMHFRKMHFRKMHFRKMQVRRVPTVARTPAAAAATPTRCRSRRTCGARRRARPHPVLRPPRRVGDLDVDGEHLYPDPEHRPLDPPAGHADHALLGDRHICASWSRTKADIDGCNVRLSVCDRELRVTLELYSSITLRTMSDVAERVPATINHRCTTS